MLSLEVLPKDLSAVAGLDALAKKLGVTIKDISIHEARLAAWDLIHRTPPLSASMKIDEASGRKAIRGDVMKMARIISDADRAAAWDVRAPVAGKAWKNSKGAVVAAQQKDWIGSASELGAAHQASRDKTSGRVSGRGSATVKIGNWTVANRVVTTAQDFSAALDKAYRKIGSLAAGWLPAFRHFASRDVIVEGRSASSKMPPAFVARHSSSGTFTDAMKTSGGGYLQGTQRWRYGYPSKLKGLVAAVMRTRERDMGGLLAKRLSKHVKDFDSGLVVFGGK